ncbi:MAG: hypothetical protein AVDCRST_MAG04-1016, partial [uncultured Acetobacteraceae bacterium]
EPVSGYRRRAGRGNGGPESQGAGGRGRPDRARQARRNLHQRRLRPDPGARQGRPARARRGAVRRLRPKGPGAGSGLPRGSPRGPADRGRSTRQEGYPGSARERGGRGPRRGRRRPLRGPPHRPARKRRTRRNGGRGPGRPLRRLRRGARPEARLPGFRARPHPQRRVGHGVASGIGGDHRCRGDRLPASLGLRGLRVQGATPGSRPEDTP